MHSAEEKTLTRAENKGSLPKLGREGCPAEVILAEVGRVTQSWLGEEGTAYAGTEQSLQGLNEGHCGWKAVRGRGS